MEVVECLDVMEGVEEVEMVPYLTVLKGEDTVDVISLDGQGILVMGRHNSCDLVVGHASSSRQHVEIQIIHGTREIVLTDLCSVHGTWLDDKRLPSMTPTLRQNNVTFRLGASRRVYRIDWQPAVASDRSSSIESDVSSSQGSALQSSSQFESKVAQFGLRRSTSSQDFLPSAPYASILDINVPPEISASPLSRPSPARRSPSRSSIELRRSLNSPRVLFPQDENASPAVRNSPASHKPGQLTRSASSPTRPTRRLAFSTLQPTVVNMRSPKSPSIRKPRTERSSSSGSMKQRPPSPRIPVNKTKATNLSEVAAPSKLWLRRCSSAPLPALATGTDTNRTQAGTLAALSEDQEEFRNENLVVLANPESDSCDEDFPSDKENIAPKSAGFSASSAGSRELSLRSQQHSVSRDSSSAVESIVREPFRPLQFVTAPDGQHLHRASVSSEDGFGARALGLPLPAYGMFSAAQNVDQMLRALKLSESAESRRQWHIVVDANCLLDAGSLKSLTLLEGIRETCLIVPKIVIRELDSLKHRHAFRSSARSALKWIESCMVKLPTWVHVQSSSEIFPVKPTPPASPATAGFPFFGDLMSPTNDEHIVECALIFAMSFRTGRVAVLTKDTSLKIKAMAEGLVAEDATEFCESLLSPYSNRFLWSGSIAHGKTWVDQRAEPSPTAFGGQHGPRTSRSHVKHSLDDLRQHVKSQPRGLKLVVP